MAADTFTGCLCADGIERWFKDGKLHRDDDLPSVIWPNESIVRWYRNGDIHRDGDQPAERYEPGGIRIWRQFGKMHRDNDQPAYVLDSGTQVWFWQGKIHRDCGRPAVVHRDKTLEWWVHGVQQTPADRRWSALRAAFVAACASPEDHRRAIGTTAVPPAPFSLAPS